MHKHTNITDRRLFQKKPTVGNYTADCDLINSSAYDDHHVSWVGSLTQLCRKQTCPTLSDPHDFLTMKSEVLPNEKQNHHIVTSCLLQEERPTHDRKAHGFHNQGKNILDYNFKSQQLHINLLPALAEEKRPSKHENRAQIKATGNQINEIKLSFGEFVDCSKVIEEKERHVHLHALESHRNSQQTEVDLAVSGKHVRYDHKPHREAQIRFHSPKHQKMSEMSQIWKKELEIIDTDPQNPNFNIEFISLHRPTFPILDQPKRLASRQQKRPHKANAAVDIQGWKVAAKPDNAEQTLEVDQMHTIV